jgi:hypothetical protein
MELTAKKNFLFECNNRLLVVTGGKDYGPDTKVLGTVGLKLPILDSVGMRV